MPSLASFRLSLERKEWRRTRPFGFVAKPTKNIDGSLNMLLWDCVIPGKKNTPREHGNYHMRMDFTNDYPSNPPQCRFTTPMIHPNISKDGYFYLPILCKSKDWIPTFSIKYILTAIQDFLHTPLETNIVNLEANNLYKTNRPNYDALIMEQARRLPPF